VRLVLLLLYVLAALAGLNLLAVVLYASLFPRFERRAEPC